MLNKKQILKIREHLEFSNNPIFFFDNDPDGLCSYILLRRYLDRGKGVAVRSHPDVDERYAKKAQELGADSVFVLDRPLLGKAFVEEIRKLNIPLIWIDHHDFANEQYDFVNTYNPQHGRKKSGEPVSYWSYKVNNRPQDAWIALMGCIADHYLPTFYKEVEERNPELWKKNITQPFQAYYTTELGKLAKVLAFGLKDFVSHVVYMQNFLTQCKNPADLMIELESSKPFAKKYREIKQKYENLIEKAKKTAKNNILFFNYGGDLSISAELSNELSFYYPNHHIIVAYSSGPITNISIRGKQARDYINQILPRFTHATGGGHPEAVGMRLQTQDLETFKDAIIHEITKQNENKKSFNH